MANTIPVPNLPTISGQEIHANNLRAFRIGNQARYELNQGLRVLYASGLLKDLEYTSITEYAEVHFGFKRSQTMESIRVAEALDTLPLSTRRFQSGAIHWSAIRALTRRPAGTSPGKVARVSPSSRSGSPTNSIGRSTSLSRSPTERAPRRCALALARARPTRAPRRSPSIRPGRCSRQTRWESRKVEARGRSRSRPSFSRCARSAGKRSS